MTPYTSPKTARRLAVEQALQGATRTSPLTAEQIKEYDEQLRDERAIDAISRADSRRRSSCRPPCTMPNIACFALAPIFCRCALNERSAQRCVRSIASRWYSLVAVGLVGSSNAKKMSAPRLC